MTMLLKNMIVISLALAFVVAGCELVTPKNDKQGSAVIGADLIISEVFTISPDKYYAYSWIELFNPSERTIRWFDQAFPVTGFVAGANGTLIATDNDGADWADIYPGSEDLYGVHFGYPDTGYAVGENGTIKIIHRLNPGWEFLDPITNPVGGTAITLRDVAGPWISPTLYVIGDNGTIMRSTSRAKDWTQQTSGTTKRLNAVYFESFTAVYVVGDSGLIMKSPRTNQWDKKTIGSAYAATNFYDVVFQGTTGFAIGDGGALLVSRNGGDTWLPETSGVSTALRGAFYSRFFNRAWIVGDDGVILKSYDTAKTWTPQISGTSASLRSVYFSDSLKGVASGAGGTVLFTTNGGRTWVPQSSGTSEDLASIYVLPPAVRIRDRLIVEMHARRNTFFFDQTAPFVPGVNPNFDFIVSRDTGSVFFDPGILADLGVADPPPGVPPSRWVIINSDSLRFKDHTNVGPGKPYFQNFSVSFTDTNLFTTRPVLWDLLDAGEIRLIRIFRKELLATREPIGPQTTEVVDVVRWGGYRPDPATTAPELLFPNNAPAGFIPEWYSLSRYVNDAGGNVNEISSAASFYMSERPIPGWYSQRAK